MYRKILVATDLTETSIPAIHAGLDLGRRLEAQVVVLHVTEPPYESRRWFISITGNEAEFFRAIAQREQDAARRVLDEQVQRASTQSARGAVETVVRSGAPAETVISTAREVGADLVVVGTHGRSGLQHALVGSIAERIIRTAPCPVLTIRQAQR